MADRIRVLKTRSATLTHTFYGAAESPVDPTGTPTCALVDANGTTVQSGNATIVGGSTGQVTFAMSAQSTVKLITATWTATVSSVSVVETDVVEVVGGFFFTLPEGRASDSSLADPAKYSTTQLETARLEVEEECEEICDRAFVPRYARVVLDGSGNPDVILTHPDPNRTPSEVRTIRAASVAPRVGETFVALTAAQLAALTVTADGVLTRTDGNVWTEARANVVVEYEYGLDGPSRELKRACLQRLRSRLNLHRSGIPDRAVSFSAADGGTYRIDLPGAFKTGIPDIDAVYARYSRRSGAGTGTPGRSVPASRQLSYDPQHWSVFHGGRR